MPAGKHKAYTGRDQRSIIPGSSAECLPQSDTNSRWLLWQLLSWKSPMEGKNRSLSLIWTAVSDLPVKSTVFKFYGKGQIILWYTWPSTRLQTSLVFTHFSAN